MSTVRVDEEALNQTLTEARELRDEFQRFLHEYEFGMREVETKISILRDEFAHHHAYNPIEHVKSRVKSPDNIVAKVARRGIDADFASIREHITDIAGVRVTCSFVADVYRLFDLLTAQDDITVRVVKDYIAHPKTNGYRSLHAILEVPVYLSTGTISVPVEVQFRTIAMDFWASLEHKIHYKFQGRCPRTSSTASPARPRPRASSTPGWSSCTARPTARRSAPCRHRRRSSPSEEPGSPDPSTRLMTAVSLGDSP